MTYDITKFHGHWFSNKEITRGGGAESAPPPAVLDSKKPGLFRVNSAMQQYFLVTGMRLEPLPPKPVLSDFYVPSEDHHNRELAFITLSMIGIGAFLWYSDK